MSFSLRITKVFLIRHILTNALGGIYVANIAKPRYSLRIQMFYDFNRGLISLVLTTNVGPNVVSGCCICNVVFRHILTAKGICNFYASWF